MTFSTSTIFIFIIVYILTLFLISIIAENNDKLKNKQIPSFIIYALSLGVYCTAWTFYGSVEMASSKGLLYLPIYLGPTACTFMWWFILKKLVRIKNKFRITSIVDFISSRYGKSIQIGVLGAILVFLGTIPYIALQIKAIIKTLYVISNPSGHYTDLHMTYNHFFLMIIISACTIYFGLRKLDSSERSYGISIFLALECLIKLFAFLAVGFFVCYYLFDGFGDIISKVPEEFSKNITFMGHSEKSSPLTFVVYFILGANAILFLPRQFHVAVIENADEKDIKKASWLFPLYLVLINLFVIPISFAGIILGNNLNNADLFMILIPLAKNNFLVAVVTFLGGFSAAMGMIMISALTTSIILSNHIILPLINTNESLKFLRSHLLKIRQFLALAVIIFSYFYAIELGENTALISMGLISFVAALQFAPLIIGGLYWKKANTKAAFSALLIGIIVWLYTLFLPAFADGDLINNSFIKDGLFGCGFLKPYALFGISGLDKISHATIWSMFFNISTYIIVSVFSTSDVKEERIADDFINIDKNLQKIVNNENDERNIFLPKKIKLIKDIFKVYLTEEEVNEAINNILEKLQIQNSTHISIGQLLLLQNESESCLAGFIGAAISHTSFSKIPIFENDEKNELAKYFEVALVNLNISPIQLMDKLNIYKEREVFLNNQTKSLEKLVETRTTDLISKNNELNSALKKLKEMQNQLIAQEKLASLGSLAAGIAHEIKNPLNFIINGAKIVQLANVSLFKSIYEDGSKDDINPNLDRLKVASQLIIDHGTRADNIVKTMLEHARTQTNDMDFYDINEIIAENLNLAIHSMKTKYPMKLTPEIIKVEINKLKLNKASIGRAFFNIIDNALYALHERCEIEDVFVPKLKIETMDDNKFVYIIIEDNGFGIDELKIKDIFNPFVTTKPTGVGTGLGLSITYEIISQHNGVVEVESKPREYTKFTIKLPYV